MSIRLLITTLIFCLLTIGCEPTFEPQPVAVIQVSPLIGDTTTVFALSGASSTSNGEIPFGLTFFWTVDDSIRLKVDSTQSKAVYKFDKLGIHRVHLEVSNIAGITHADTAEIKVILFKKDSFMIDLRDGRRYSTVLLNDTWWFTENLKYGKIISNSQLPLHNGIVERYSRYPESGHSDGYYTPEEAHQYSTDPVACICPPGWTLPDSRTIEQLSERYWFTGQHEFFVPGGILGINLDYPGYYNLDSLHFEEFPGGLWWAPEIYTDDAGQKAYNVMYSQQALHWFNRPYYTINISFPELVPFRFYRIALPIRCINKI